MKFVEPPSHRYPSTIVLIGRNRHGNWVVQEQHGLYGGLFVNRTQARRYALFENGHHREMIVELSGEIELDMKAPVEIAARLRGPDGAEHNPGVSPRSDSGISLRSIRATRA